MSKFVEWIFGMDAPEWITGLAILTLIAVTIAWFVCAIAAATTGHLLLIIGAAVPPAVAWMLAWETFRNREDK